MTDTDCGHKTSESARVLAPIVTVFKKKNAEATENHRPLNGPF